MLENILFDAYRKAGTVELALESARSLMTGEEDLAALVKYTVYILTVTDHDTEAFQIWEDLVTSSVCLLSEDHALSHRKLLHLARQNRICFASSSPRNAGRYGYKEGCVAIDKVLIRENRPFYYESFDKELEADLESEKGLT